jgi:hypothetical protein
MESKEKNPIVLVEAISILPSLIKTLGSVFKRKKDKPEEDKEKPEGAGAQVVESIKDAVSGEISSKKLLNIGGFGLIIAIAISDIGIRGITKQNLVLVGLGVAYSIAMSLITAWGERK